MIIYLCTKNDAKGKPRRAYGEFHKQTIVGFYEEPIPYEAMPDSMRDKFNNAPEINVPVGEWLHFRCMAKAWAKFQNDLATCDYVVAQELPSGERVPLPLKDVFHVCKANTILRSYEP